MRLFGKKKQAGGGVLCLIATERRCHAGVRRAEGGFEVHSFPVDPGREAPLEALAWGYERGAAAVKLAVMAEPREITLDFADNLEYEEIAGAVAWEQAGQTGQTAEEIRCAFIESANLVSDSSDKAALFHAADAADSRSRHLLAASFPLAKLNAYASRGVGGLVFAGIGSTQALLAAWHSRTVADPSETLFQIGDKSSLAVVAGLRGHNLVLRPLPFGAPAAQDLEQWSDRLKKRLSVAAGRPLRAVAAANLPEGGEAALAEALGGVAVRCETFESCLPGLFEILAAATPGDYNADFSLCVAPPVPKDPRAAATTLFLVMTLGTLAALGAQFGLLELNLARVKGKIAAKEAVEAGRKSAEERLASLRKEIEATGAMRRCLSGELRVDPNFLVALDLLGRYRPRYSRFTEIVQEGDRTRLEGYTVWTEDLDKLMEHLRRRLSARGLSLIHKGLRDAAPGSREKPFSYDIVRRGR